MESEHAMDAFMEEQKSNIVPSSSSTSQQMSVSVDEDVNVDDLNALSLDEIIENGMKSLAEASILIDQASKVTEVCLHPFVCKALIFCLCCFN